MRPAPAKEDDASLADIAVRVTAEASSAAAAAAEMGDDTEAEAAALLDSSAVEDQVRYSCACVLGGGRGAEGGGREELPLICPRRGEESTPACC